MASNINPNNINKIFPIAGQDNDSQGFRDNFTNISNNLVVAAAELSDLQSKAVLTSALDVNGSTINNNMNGTLISNALTSKFTKLAVDWGIVTTASMPAIDFNNGDFQKFALKTDINVNIINPPIGANYSTLRVWLNISTSGGAFPTILFSSPIQVGTSFIPGTVKDITTQQWAWTPIQEGDYIFELATLDYGTTYSIQTLISPTATSALQINTLFGDVAHLQANVANVSANSTTLQGNIVTINSEVSVLQGNVVSINATLANVMLLNTSNVLTGNINMNTHVITNATLSNTMNFVPSQLNNLSSSVNPVTLDVRESDFFELILSGPVALFFSNWIIGGTYSVRRLAIQMTSATPLTLPSGAQFSASSIPLIQTVNISAPNAIVLTPINPGGNGWYLFEVSTFNGGATTHWVQLTHPAL
jgi:hypothetical protein